MTDNREDGYYLVNAIREVLGLGPLFVNDRVPMTLRLGRAFMAPALGYFDNLPARKAGAWKGFQE